MKLKIHFFLWVMLSAVTIFVSCKKDETPTPVREEEPTLFDTILGKWEFDYSSGRTAGRNQPSGKNQGLPQLLSIEFLSDSTYIVLVDGGEIIEGNFSIADSTINLSEFGFLSDVTFAGEVLNVVLTSTDWGVLTLSAGKAEQIPAGIPTSLICQKWKLTSEDFGPAIFYAQRAHGYFDVTLQLSQSGTYFIKQYSGDTLLIIRNTAWQWTPGKDSSITVDLGEGQSKPVKVAELTSQSLKLEEEHQEKTLHYNFVPVQ